MHLNSEALGGGILCGMRGESTTERKAVDCKRCIRMMDRVKVGPSRISKVTVAKTGKRATGEVVKPDKEVDKKGPVEVVKKVEKEFPLCLCGCVDEKGNRQHTKGGRFRPGHDARYHAALKGPRPEKPVREKAAPKQKLPLTGDHKLDTVLGMIKSFNVDQMAILFRVLNERYGMGTVKVA